MIRQFFEQLLTPNTELSENEVQHWRERIVAVALTGASLLGTGAYAINMYLVLQINAWWWAIIYTLAFSGVIFITVRKKLAYEIKAGAMLLLLYILGIVSALQYGTAGDVRIWFFGFTIVAAIFLGMRAGLVAAVFSSLTHLGLGYAMSLDWIEAPNVSKVIEPSNFASWVSTSIPYFALGIMAVLAVGVIINGLDRNLLRSRELTAELKADRASLQRRTDTLERRNIQIRTAAEISRIVSGELDQRKLLQQVADLIRDRFDLYYAGVFLVDEKGLYAVLQAGTGEPGAAMIRAHHRLPIGGTSMIGWSISRRKARIALDIGQDAVRFDNPYLPETRSELALPMISGAQVLGAITIQSAEAGAFDQDDIAILQNVADGLATALENARLFQQAQENLEEIQRLHQQYLGEAWSQIAKLESNLAYQHQDNLAENEQPGVRIEKEMLLRGQKIGKIQLESNRSGWTDEDDALVEAVALQAALALENIRLVEETQRNAQHDRIVADVTRKAWASSNLDTILKTTLSELGKTLQASDGIIQLEMPEEV